MRQKLSAAVLFALTAVLSLAARAFTADGFTSGMSPSDLASVAASRSLEAWEHSDGIFAVGKRSESRVDGTFTFCDSKLFAYNRVLDFDVEYFQTVQRFLAEFGQPNRLTTEEQPWPGPGGGYVRSVQLLWTRGDDRVTLSVIPEGRDGRGALRHNRSATVSYLSRTRCSAKQFAKP